MGKKKNKFRNELYRTDERAQAEALDMLDAILAGEPVDISSDSNDIPESFTEEDDIFTNGLKDIMRDKHNNKQNAPVKPKSNPKPVKNVECKKIEKVIPKTVKLVDMSEDKTAYGITFQHITCGVTNLLKISDNLRNATVDLGSVCNALEPFDSEDVEELVDMYIKFIMPTFVPQMVSTFASIKNVSITYQNDPTYPDDIFHFYSVDDSVIGYYINPAGLKEFRTLCDEMNEHGLLLDLFLKISTVLMAEGFNNAIIRGGRMSMFTQTKTWQDYQNMFLNRFKNMVTGTSSGTGMTIYDVINANDSILPLSHYENFEGFMKKLIGSNEDDDYEIDNDDEDDIEDDSEGETVDEREVMDWDTFKQSLETSTTVGDDIKADNLEVEEGETMSFDAKSTDATQREVSPIVAHMRAMQELATNNDLHITEETDEFADLCNEEEDDDGELTATEIPETKPSEPDEDDNFVVARRR